MNLQLFPFVQPGQEAIPLKFLFMTITQLVMDSNSHSLGRNLLGDFPDNA